MSTADLSLFHLTRPPRQAGAGQPPLLLLLHGYGSFEGDLLPIADYLDPRCFVVSARAPITLGQGAYAWFNLDFSPTGPGIAVRTAEIEAARAALARFLAEVVPAYEVDAERVYLMGFSQGAIMGSLIALTEPDAVAGAILMSGRVPEQVAEHLAPPDQLAGLPLLVVHGVHDEVLPINHGRSSRDILARLPVDLTYREYPMGHWTTPESIRDIAVWLRNHLDAPRRSAG